MRAEPVEAADLHHGDHACLAFADEAEQRSVMTAYLAEGLRRRERVAYFADQLDPAVVAGWLREAGLDPAALAAEGRLVLTTVRESYLASGTFDPDAMVATLHREVADSLAVGYTGFRVSGEMGWGRGPTPGADRLREYETKVHAVFAGQRASAICQYDLRRFDADQIDAFQDCHPKAAALPPLYEDGLLRLAPVLRDGRRMLQVTGTVDYRTTQVLAEALRTAARWPGDIWVDMSALEFMDLAGVRVMSQVAEKLTPGRILNVVDLEPLLGQVMNLAGWDQQPALHVQPTGART